MAAPDVVHKLTLPCHPGLVITIDGFIQPEKTRIVDLSYRNRCNPGLVNRSFSINLSTSPTFLGGDIALHVNPRFNEANVLARNSYQNGQWKVEERDGPPAPVQKNATFRCKIESMQDRFMISINDQTSWEFRHRIPQEKVHWLIIRGVQVNDVTFTG